VVKQSVRGLIFLALTLAGCDQQASLDASMPQDESAAARSVMAQLLARDFDGVERKLSSRTRTPLVRSQLEQIAAALPESAPRTVRNVAAHWFISPSAATYDLSFEYEFENAWVLANVVLERRDSLLTVLGIHVTRQAQPLATIHRFSLQGKTLLHYAVFGLAIVIPIFCVFTLIACVRAERFAKKWVWLLFVLFGVMRFRLNWTDGVWSLQPIAVTLLGAGFMRTGLVSPWILSISLPLGAILYWVKRRKLGNEAKPTAVAAEVK
jgi:hypothetical protein